MIYNNLLEMIGQTPIVNITAAFNTGPCELLIKLESNNPGGSIKDRMALAMIEAAEKEGKLKPGDTIIEATAGNTGLALALVAIAKGYRLMLVLPDKMSPEKIAHLKALGAEISVTRSDVEKGHPEYYQDLAARIARETPNMFYVNQFANPNNPLAHEQTTGAEIWQQTNQHLDAFVYGMGSCGAMTGISRYLKKVNPQIDIILADPEGSILADEINTGSHGKAGKWLVEGIGEDFVPSIADLSLVDEAYTISDQQSFSAARMLLRKTGIFAGSSTGTHIQAALNYCQKQTAFKRVLTIACDQGGKYLSKMFNDNWMKEKGFTL